MISIIIPLYNKEANIGKVIETFMNEKSIEHELIVVDDGSTDNSYNVACQYKEKYDNLKVIHTENKGSGNARNVGLEHAKYEYVYFADSDDRVSNEFLRTVSLYLKRNKMCDMLVFAYDVIKGNGIFEGISKRRDAIFKGDYVRNNYHEFYYTDELDVRGAPWNKVFRKSLIIKNNVKFPLLRRHQDQVFILKYLTHCSEIHFISDVLYTYRRGSNMKSVVKRYPDNYFEIIKEFFNIQLQILEDWDIKDKKSCMKKMYAEFYEYMLTAFQCISYNYTFSEAKRRISKILNEDVAKRLIDNIDLKLLANKNQSYVCRYIKNKNATVIYLFYKKQIYEMAIKTFIKGILHINR